VKGRSGARLLLMLAAWVLTLCGIGCDDGDSPAVEAASQTSMTVQTASPAGPSAAQAVLEGMTLEEKAGQVVVLAFNGKTLTDTVAGLMEEYRPAGFLLMGANISGDGQLRSLTAALQAKAAEAGLQLPLFIAVDQEGGTLQRIRGSAPDMPSARSLGAQSTPAEAADLARRTGRVLLSLGVNMNLAPVADVVWGESFIRSRSYSGDPAVVSEFVSAVVTAYQEAGLIAVVKHFPGHGSSEGNPHNSEVFSYASSELFEAVHLPPFEAAIAAGAKAIMVSHITVTAYDGARPASQSEAVVTGLLRGRLGYDGLVVTDSIRMAASADKIGIAAAAVEALDAGCDLLLVRDIPERQRKVIETVAEAVRTGWLSEERLDEAVLKVLETKAWLQDAGM
jgi:beta-N-acetylhexosaminidase